jgi:hypothetical protein
VEEKRRAETERLSVVDRINERNRVANFREAMKSQRQATSAENTLDPFSRRRCLPAVDTLRGKKRLADPVPAAAAAAAAAAPAAAPSAADAAAAAAAKEAKLTKGAPEATQMGKSRADFGADLQAAHNIIQPMDMSFLAGAYLVGGFVACVVDRHRVGADERRIAADPAALRRLLGAPLVPLPSSVAVNDSRRRLPVV